MSRPALRTPSRRRRRGFMLLEILFVLLLLGIFAAVAVSIFGSSMKVIRRSAQAEAATASAESAMRALRADVWDGRAFAAEGGVAIQVTRSDGTARWFVDNESALVRAFTPATSADAAAAAAAGREQRWPDLGGRVSFEAAGPTVIARVAGTPGTPPAEVRMVSQVLLASAAPGEAAREGKP